MAIGNSSDVLVIGGGIFGLCCAYACADAGLSVVVLDAGKIGGGASGGPVGAMSPHTPDQWNAKKQFQYEALKDAPRFWEEVEATNGRPSGYGQVGRLMPILTQDQLSLAKGRCADADRNWGGQANWTTRPADAFGEWIDPAAAPIGVIHETLSARISPRDALGSLAEACHTKGVRIFEQAPVSSLEGRTAITPQDRYSCAHVIIATGHAQLPHLPKGLISGVKGQAARLSGGPDNRLPSIFSDGLYIVPHFDGTVAVGSTSENAWEDPHGVDERLESLIETARRTCPPLRRMEVVDRWAGIRPKARRRDPLLGQWPGHPGCLLALGGFKIGFGIAHKVGYVLRDMIQGHAVELPDSFSYDHHAKGLPDA